MQFVLDCSVAMSWFFEDESDPYSEGVLNSLKINEAIVPILWHLEVSNVFLVAEKRKRITESKIIHNMNLIDSLPIKVQISSPMREIYILARQFGLSSYDATYLDLAMRLGLPLATRDNQLKSSAKSSGIPLYFSKEKK